MFLSSFDNFNRLIIFNIDSVEKMDQMGHFFSKINNSNFFNNFKFICVALNLMM